MLEAASLLGGIGGGGGAGGGQYSSSATSKSDASFSGRQDNSNATGGGNRGFINNVAFPGATLSTSQAVNEPFLSSSSLPLLALCGALGVVLFILWRHH